MAIWNIEVLRDGLKEMLDQESFEQARSLLYSLDWKIRAEKYHTRVAEKAFSEYFGSLAISCDKAVKLVLINNEDGAKFAYSQSVREFNLVAAVSASHTTLELFSQLIAVLFFPRKFNVHEITIGKILSQLPNGALRLKLEEITQSEVYDYLRVFSNMLKHINLVIPEYYISFKEKEYHGIRFKEFVYKGITYQSKRDVELMKDLRTLRIRFVELGILISDSMQSN